MAKPDKVQLFISHHSSKYEVAQEVEALLVKRSINCWIAPRDVPPGAPFDTAISEAIGQSAAILLLFCSNSDKSRHVKRELILGDSAGRPIIPLRLEAIDPGELAYHLADSQWIDWIDRREAVMDRVAAQVRLYAGAPAELADDVRTLGAEALAGAGEERPAPPEPDEAPVAHGDASEERKWLVPALALALVAAVITIGVIVTQQGSRETSPSSDDAAMSEVEAAAEDAAAFLAEEEGEPAPPPAGTQPTGTPTAVPTGPIARPTDLVATPVSPTPTPRPTATLLIDPALATRAAQDQAVRRVVDGCRGAASDAEYLICADPEFSERAQLIGLLSNDIRGLLAEVGADPDPFNRDQRMWFNGVKAQCQTSECVESEQRARISHLLNVKTQFIIGRAQEDQ